MRTLAAAVIWTCVVVPVHGFAEPASHTDNRASEITKPVTDDCARARRAGKTCVLEIPAEDVDGQAPSSDGIRTRILVLGTAASLIHVRHDFLPEIVKSAEDL